MPTLSSSSRSTLPMPEAHPPARCAPASASAPSADRSRDWGLRRACSARRAAPWMHRRQRCLLSSPTDCLISSTRRSTSARMVFSDATMACVAAQAPPCNAARDVAACASQSAIGLRRPSCSVQPAGAGAHDGAVGVRRSPASRSAVGIGNADDRVIVRRRGARLEGFQDGPAAFAGPARMPVLEIDPDQLDAGRHPERNRRLVGERKLQEIAGDRRGEMAAGARRRPRLRGLS